jgi:hypothetical protein
MELKVARCAAQGSASVVMTLTVHAALSVTQVLNPSSLSCPLPTPREFEIDIA